MPELIRILHLSDLVPQTAGIDVPAALSRLKDSIAEKIGAHAIDYIVVCGNISAPSAPRFDQAAEIIRDLARDFLVDDGTGMSRVLIVPGMRDVAMDGREIKANLTDFAQFHNTFFATEIRDRKVGVFQDAEHALCCELKDLRFIGVSFWQSQSRQAEQELLMNFEAAIRDANKQIGAISENTFAKSRPALLVSAGTPPPSWDKADKRFQPMERLKEDLKTLNISLHLFGSGQVTGILPHPFLFDHVSLGTGIRDETGFWPLQANLIEIRSELYRSRDSGELESFLLSSIALLKRGPDEPFASEKHIRGHLDLFLRPAEKGLAQAAAVYTSFLETLARLIFQERYAFVILSGLPGSGKFDFIEFLRTCPAWQNYPICAELIELRDLRYDTNKFKRELKRTRRNFKQRATSEQKKILIVRDLVFAGLSNQDKDSVRQLWPLIQQIEGLDAVIYAMPTVDYVLNYDPLPKRSKRVALPALNADGMRALLKEYEPKFPVTNKLKDISGQYAGFSRMLLNEAGNEFRKLPGAEPIRSGTASELLLRALKSEQVKDESAWYLSTIRSMAGGREICDFLVKEASKHKLGDAVCFDAEAMRSEIRDENGRATLDPTLDQLCEMGALDFEKGQYRVRVTAPFIVEGWKNGRTPAPPAAPMYGKRAAASSDLSTPRSIAKAGAIDFLIVVPLQEELNALLRQLPSHARLDPSEDFVHAAFAATLQVEMPQGARGQYELILLPLLGMGPVEAASATANALKRWKSRFVVLVGIAGGVAKAGAAPGDILIADQIVDYSLEKVREGSAEPRYHVFGTDPTLCSAAKLFAAPELKLGQRPAPGKIKVLYGPVASGNRVMAGGADLDRLLQSWPKLIGVEMEAGGVAAAASENSHRPGFFMVRGVSDNADSKKDSPGVGAIRGYAAEAAAAYLIELLSQAPVVFSTEQRSPSQAVPSLPPAAASAPAAQTVAAPAGDPYAQLAEYVVVSGRASSNARRSLCIRIGVEYTKLDFFENTAAADFATDLVDHLRRIGDHAALHKLCGALTDVLKGDLAQRVQEINRSLPA